MASPFMMIERLPVDATGAMKAEDTESDETARKRNMAQGVAGLSGPSSKMRIVKISDREIDFLWF